MKLDDIQILERIKNGNTDVFKHLYDLYYNQLFCIARKYIHDDFTAETIVSDVFFGLWQKKELITIHTSLNAYLIRSVRNHSINFLNKSYLKKEVCIDEIEITSPLYFTSEEYPLGQLLEKELHENIQTEIDALPKETRHVFLLSRVDELTYDEIAQQLDISVNTVKYHVKQALRILRSKLFDLI